MIRVSVELWPGGRQEEKWQLAVLHLSNITEGQSGLQDYAVYASEGVNEPAQRGRWESRGLIAGHDRTDASVWSLVQKAAAFASAEAEKR